MEGISIMTLANSDSTPAKRTGDLERIERALRAAVRNALLRHKRDGDPVVVWREGRVVSLPPEQIPNFDDELHETTLDNTADRRPSRN
jgi:hypothetical protein